jgi:cytochrome b561
MPIKKYSNTLIALHWILALLIAGMLTVGWYMASIAEKPQSAILFTAHKSTGLIVAALVLFRLTWRLTHKSPPLPTTIPKVQAFTARMVHWLLYVCMICMPLTGAIGTAFGKKNLVFFNYQFPRFVEQNDYINKLSFSLHQTIAWIFLTLIVMHIFAAMWHLLVKRDEIFNRIWF